MVEVAEAAEAAEAAEVVVINNLYAVRSALTLESDIRFDAFTRSAFPSFYGHFQMTPLRPLLKIVSLL